MEDLNALADREVVREIGRHREHIAKAEAKVATLRGARDALIAYCHSVGMPVAALARDAGISRQSAYQALRRCRKETGDASD